LLGRGEDKESECNGTTKKDRMILKFKPNTMRRESCLQHLSTEESKILHYVHSSIQTHTLLSHVHIVNSRYDKTLWNAV